MPRLFILTLLLAVSLRAESVADAFSDRRKDLQGQFSRAQAPIYPDPTKASEAAFAEMQKVNVTVNVLKTDFAAFEEARYRAWNTKSYWYYGNINYWDKGPGARYILEKLWTQIAKVKAMTAKESGPIARPDLNDSQKLLDAIREALVLDGDLEKIVRTNLRR